MKITGDTTVNQLMIYRQQLGVKWVGMEVSGSRYLAAIRHPQYGHFVQTADTEADALDGAYAQLRQAIAHAHGDTLS